MKIHVDSLEATQTQQIWISARVENIELKQNFCTDIETAHDVNVADVQTFMNNNGAEYNNHWS